MTKLEDYIFWLWIYNSKKKWLADEKSILGSYLKQEERGMSFARINFIKKTVGSVKYNGIDNVLHNFISIFYKYNSNQVKKSGIHLFVVSYIKEMKYKEEVEYCEELNNYLNQLHIGIITPKKGDQSEKVS